MADKNIIPDKIDIESLTKDLKPLTEEESLAIFYAP